MHSPEYLYRNTTIETNNQATHFENTATEKLFSLFELLKEQPTTIEGKYLYKLHFMVQLSEDNISHYRSTTLNSIIRGLLNSKRSISGLSNRIWFNKHFPGGGFYRISMEQKHPHSYPIVHYHMYCFGNKPDLHRQIQNSLLIRFKKQAISGQAGISGGESIQSVEECLKHITQELQDKQYQIYLDSEPIAMLGKAFKKWTLTLMNGDLRCFGNLYKLTHSTSENTYE